ncbi:DUF3732 domain-containing protein [Chloroflexota bacterium]
MQNDIRIPMINIGADENFLSIHIALFLAFQRFFKEHSRPVPGLLVIDQLTRPYFPNLHAEIESEIEVENSTEVERPKRYFDYLFNEVQNQESLQIIILEHAYFKDDLRFTNATKERWINGKGLVPHDWPQS